MTVQQALHRSLPQSENDVHVPQLHQALAHWMSAEVYTLEGCQCFETDLRNMLDSHNVASIGHLKPALVVTEIRWLLFCAHYPSHAMHLHDKYID